MNIKKLVASMNTLNNKVKISLLIVAIIPLLVYLVLNNLSLTKNFTILEEKNIEKESYHANTIIKAKSSEIVTIAKDYAIWDDAYNKISAKDTGWFKETVTGWIPGNFGVDLIVVANTKKEIIDQYGIENGNYGNLLSDDTVDNVLRGKITGEKEPENNKLSGFITYNGELYIIGLSPIMKNYYKGSTRGIIILGKKITPELLDGIQKTYGYTMLFSNGNKIIAPNSESKEKNKFYSFYLLGRQKVVRINDSLNMSSLPLKDISGNNLGYQFIIEPRAEFLSTLNILSKNAYLVLFFSILITILLNIKIKRIIVMPINNLEEQISVMGENSVLDYLDIKGPKEIVSLATAFNKMAERILAHKKENESLKNLSIKDGLTNLYNHRYFFEYFNCKLTEGVKNFSILFCDIDHFKIVNDVNGHLAGDVILTEIAKIIEEVVVKKGMAFRYGGEEFIVLIENSLPNEAFDIAEVIRRRVAKSRFLLDHSGYLPVTISIGISSYPINALDVENLVEKADSAMYFAKQNGRNQCQMYDPSIDELKINKVIQQEVLLESVYTLVAAIDAKDTYTERHSKMVTKYALGLAGKLKMSEEDINILRIGCLLHDCGKIGIPDDIIHKTTPLTHEEIEVIKNHPTLGSNMVKYIIKTKEIISCIRFHHERWDGKGYPEGLSGNEIPIYARIACIADSYHAMISDRPYRRAMSRAEAFLELRKCKEKQFETELVEVFIESIMEYDAEKDEYEIV